MRRLVGAALLVPLTLAGCFASPTPKPPTTPDEIIGEWRLTDGALDGVAIAPSAERPITFRWNSAELGGDGGCNHYGAVEVRLSAGVISMDSVISTMIGCPGQVGEAEVLYFRALDGANRFAIIAGKLRIIGPGVTLTFERMGG